MPHDSLLVKQVDNLATDKATTASYRFLFFFKGPLLVPTGAVGGPHLRKENRTAPQLLFPFLLKIDPNTLYIIQKFRSLVAVTGKTGPAAPMIHRLQGTGSQGAVAEPWGMPVSKDCSLWQQPAGVGAVLGTAFPTPPNGKD